MRIRPVKLEDASEINRINENSLTRNIFVNFASHHFDDAEKLIAGLTQFDHMLVLETETPPKEICAVALLRVNPQIYRRRMATLRIIVEKKWQGQGLGKAIAAAAVSLADNELMIERVEVEIPTENVGALKLCKATGFRVEGVARDWLRTLDGKYADAYLMAHCKEAK